MHLDNGEVVRFWEVEPGEVAIEVSSNMDEVASPSSVLNEDLVHYSLVEIHEMLRPRLADVRLREVESPVALLDADLRIRLRDRAAAYQEAVLATAQRGGTGGSAPLGPSPRSECPNDGHWHSWACDAAWFVQTFCTDGLFQWCPTNLNGWAYSGDRGNNTSYFDAVGCAAGFDSTARFQAKYKSCGWGWDPWPSYTCHWKTARTVTLSPRDCTGWGWTSTGSRWAGIDNSSDRIHFAVKWTPDGSSGGSSSSHSGPCNDENESCCASSGGGASQYCNNGLHCQSGTCISCDSYADSCCIPSGGGASSGYCEDGFTCSGGVCL